MSESDKGDMQGRKKVMFGMAALGVAILFYNVFGGGDQNNGNEKAAKPPVSVEVGSEGVNDLGITDRDAALTQFAKKMESMEHKLALAEEAKALSDSKVQRDLRELEQKKNAELRAITEELTLIREERVNGTYKDADATDTGTDLNLTPASSLPDGGLGADDFDLNIGGTQESKNPVDSRYGPGYFILNPGRQTGQSAPAGGASDSATEQDLFNEMSMPLPDANGVERAATVSDNNMNQMMADLRQEPQPAAKQLPPTDPVDVPVPAVAGPKREQYIIPAFSYVEVTTLHGVSCPIGANAPGNSSEKGIPARPVVLPVRGIFHGPNGVQRDLGTIHLMGLCSGNRTSSSSTGRATVHVEQLSYWDEAGNAQHVPSVGYIVDDRDNAQDIYGRLDSASGRTLALQSAAAAAAAYATTLSQAEFTNSTSIEGGTTSAQSTLTGDATKAAVQQGIAGMFTKISERFEREANSAVDTIIVEPGIKLKFITELPISVFKPAEPFDIDASRYDVLI